MDQNTFKDFNSTKLLNQFLPTRDWDLRFSRFNINLMTSKCLNKSSKKIDLSRHCNRPGGRSCLGFCVACIRMTTDRYEELVEKK